MVLRWLLLPIVIGCLVLAGHAAYVNDWFVALGSTCNAITFSMLFVTIRNLSLVKSTLDKAERNIALANEHNTQTIRLLKGEPDY